jgi:hypothetical protein
MARWGYRTEEAIMQALKVRVTFSSFLAGLLLSAGALLMWPSSTSAGTIFGTPFWGIDGAYTTSYTVSGYLQTGYSYYPWIWYYNNNPYYYNGWCVNNFPYLYPWLNGWGGGPGFFACTDLERYIWTETQTLYRFSWYWDPNNRVNMLDVLGFAGPTGIQPLSLADAGNFSEVESAAAGNDGAFFGTPSAPIWVPDDVADVNAALLGMGVSQTDATTFENTQAMQDLFDSGNSSNVIGLSCCVPEPASLALVAVGALGLMMRPGRRSSK